MVIKIEIICPKCGKEMRIISEEYGYDCECSECGALAYGIRIPKPIEIATN